MSQKSTIYVLVFLAVISSIATFFLVDRTQAAWFKDFWGIVGTNLSVLGIIYTVVQIRMLKVESEIIINTTNETRERMASINRNASIEKAMKLIQEIQGYTRIHKFEFGVMRLQELKIIFGQMKLFNASMRRPLDIDATIARLNQLINGMEKDIGARTISVKPAAVNASLERILDTLVDIQSETLQRN